MNNYLVKNTVYVCNISRNGACSIPHQLISFYDLTIVLKGELRYTANGKPLVLRKNDAMLLAPGTVRTRELQTEYVKYVSFNFLILDDVSLPLEQYLPNTITDEIKKILSLIPNMYISADDTSEAKHTNLLNCILFELLNAAAFKSNNSHIQNIISYIEKNITKKLTLQDISNAIGLTKEYTACIFKKETGYTITEYVNERKMLYAKELISHNEMSLPELSSYLGYENYSYFSKLFKRQFNVAPCKMKPR